MNIVTMVSFTFDPPSDAPAWGVAMVEAFKQCVTSSCTEIQTMNNNLESKFDQMSQLVKDVKSADKMVSSAMDIALAFESDIKNLQQDMSELKLKYKGLDTAYTALQNKCSKRDCYRPISQTVFMLSIAINRAEHVCATVIIKHNCMLMCNHKIVINIMLCL